MFEDAPLQDLLDIVEPLLASTDKFQQAAAAEILTGLLRGMLIAAHISTYLSAIGSKHWSQQSLNALWGWFVPRLDRILSQARPDTVVYWTSFLQVSVPHCCSYHVAELLDAKTVLEDRDPRRNKPLVDWILSLQLEFQGDSAFAGIST